MMLIENKVESYRASKAEKEIFSGRDTYEEINEGWNLLWFGFIAIEIALTNKIESIRV